MYDQNLASYLSRFINRIMYDQCLIPDEYLPRNRGQDYISTDYIPRLAQVE